MAKINFKKGKNIIKGISIPKFLAVIAAVAAAVALIGLTLYFTNVIKLGQSDYDVKIKGSGVEIIKYTGSEKNITVPESFNSRKVVSIGDKAFYNNDDIVNVTLPHTVRIVGERVFAQCGSLNEVVFSSEYTDFGNNVFEASSVKKVRLPGALQKIGDGMFKNCEKVKQVTFPDNLKEIGKEAFCGCTSIENMIIGEAVFKIGENAFGEGSPKLVLSSTVGSVTEKYASENGINFAPCDSFYRPYREYAITEGKNNLRTANVSESNKGILSFTPEYDGYYRIALESGKKVSLDADSSGENTCICPSVRNNKNDVICNLNLGNTYYFNVLSQENAKYTVNVQRISGSLAEMFVQGEKLLKGKSEYKITAGTALRESSKMSADIAATVNSRITISRVLDYYVESEKRVWYKISANVGGRGKKNLWFSDTKQN